MRSCPRCRSIYSTHVEYCGLDGERLVETETDPLIGSTVERYRIEERLGAGGMALVYRASHATLAGKEYAIKVLLGEMASDRNVAGRFTREAETTAKINHPNVVNVIDFGTTQDGLTFLVMEMLRGRSLADAIHEDGPFTPERAADVLRQIASGLSAAHAHGFVHRDLKPGNVMLVEHGGREIAKILDFGLVRVAREPADAKGRLTATGLTMGTPYYMAPEQIRGGEVTASSDLYALGTVLYEMLAGKPPFEGTVTEVLLKHAVEPPPKLLPANGLDLLCARLLEKDPAARPPNAQAVVAAIDGLGLSAPGSVPLMLASSAPRMPAGDPARAPLVQPPLLARTMGEAAVIETGGLPEPERRPIGLIVAAAAALVILGVMGALLLGGKTEVVVVESLPPPPIAPVVPAPAAAIAPAHHVQHPAPVAAPETAPSAAVAPAAVPVQEEEGPRRPIAELDGEIGKAVQRRGLVLDDLSALDATRAPLEAWRAAKRVKDVVAANVAARKLLQEIPRARVDAALVKIKLDGVYRRLASESPRIPKATYQRLEGQYLDLSEQASSAGLSPEASGKLLVQVANLRRQVDADALAGSKN